MVVVSQDAELLHTLCMTNPERARSHFKVIDLVAVSTASGVSLRLKVRGEATVPLAPHTVPTPAPASADR